MLWDCRQLLPHLTHVEVVERCNETNQRDNIKGSGHLPPMRIDSIKKKLLQQTWP